MEPSLATMAYNIDASNSPITVTVGNLGTETITSVINVNNNNQRIDGTHVEVDGATVKYPSIYLSYFEQGVTVRMKIVTSGGTELPFTITK